MLCELNLTNNLKKKNEIKGIKLSINYYLVILCLAIY